MTEDWADYREECRQDAERERQKARGVTIGGTDGVKKLLQVDDLDTRDESRRLLELLSPAQRVAYLRWACTKARIPTGIMPNHSGHVLEVFQDLFGLIHSYGADPAVLLAGLEQFVRRAK